MKEVDSQNSIKKTIQRLERWSGEKRVVVGLSGGVDSSFAASLLTNAKWNVEGLTLWLMEGKGSCCTEGLVDAGGICKQLAIPHHIIDARKNFKDQVINNILDGYKNGITPLPCSKCNRSVKFGPMLEWAEKEKGINYLATGHYARIKRNKMNGKYELLRGLDKNKDQSYFLYDLPQQILKRLIFPLGEITKNETRVGAKKQALRTANKPESQDLCLTEKHGSMRKFLDKYLAPRYGHIVLSNGSIVGTHDGIEHFTIGQRKGIGIAWKEPLYVIEIDSVMNRVIVAPKEEGKKKICSVNKVNWISIDSPKESINVEVQLRYRSQPVKAKVIPMNSEKSMSLDHELTDYKLEFEQEQYFITPGQAAVFYNNDILLGGGIIKVN